MESDFLKSKIENALIDLSLYITEEGPFITERHLNHIIRGISSNPEQLTDIGWVILGFYARICEKRFEIINTIDGVNGTGKLLCENIRNTLRGESEILRSEEYNDQIQIDKNRNPLLYELIVHVLLYVLSRKKDHTFLKFGLVDISPPHTKVFSQGIDLLGVVSDNGINLPLIGEMKSYENDPKKGFRDACEIFIKINKGKYNTEIKSVYEHRDSLSRNELANNIWLRKSVFSAFIGHDAIHIVQKNFKSKASNVINTKCHTLVNCATPITKMKRMFEILVTVLYDCLIELEDQYD